MRMLCAAVRRSLFRLLPARMANDKKCDDPDRKADEQILHGSVLLFAVHYFSRLAVSSRLSRSPVGVAADRPRSYADILVTAHSFDADDRPLSTYEFVRARFLHIGGVYRQG